MMWNTTNSIWTYPFLINWDQIQCLIPPAYQLLPFQTTLPQTPSFEEKQEISISFSQKKIQINQSIPLPGIQLRKRNKISKNKNKNTRIIDSEFQKKSQKKDRNVPSNICRYFISHICKHPDPIRLLPTANSLQNITELYQCIEQVKKHVDPRQTYIRPRIIEQMCKGELMTPETARILRILMKKFLTEELKMIISAQGNLKKKEKFAYFRIAKRHLKAFCYS